MSDDEADVFEFVGGSVREAGEAAGLPGRAVAGFDGGAKRWTWADHSPEGRVAEVVVLCSNDPLGRGVLVEVLAVARGRGKGYSWSASVCARHLDPEALDRPGEELRAFEEELPTRLREGIGKARVVAPVIEELHERRQERLREVAREHDHLFAEGT